MSDKSFCDQTNRNIVKNPLLSSAVTGLSIEDLTHNAVLLPALQAQGMENRQGQNLIDAGPIPTQSANQIRGDENSNIPQSQNTPVPKPAKTHDDFDVNEYFARLQGTRYVSAPLSSHLSEETNPNLAATEETLEEINLNDSEDRPVVEQSLTADIAQNFSQLPTVLPQMASAVFSSFSNMLSYKSREVTPDERAGPNQSFPSHQNVGQQNIGPQNSGIGQQSYGIGNQNSGVGQQSYNMGNQSSGIGQQYSGVGHQSYEIGQQNMGASRPDIGVPPTGAAEATREVAPPPKEPPISGPANYRMTAKKKTYAQIPGLTSRVTAQNVALYDPFANLSQNNVTPYYVPDSNITQAPDVPLPESSNLFQNDKVKKTVVADGFETLDVGDDSQNKNVYTNIYNVNSAALDSFSTQNIPYRVTSNQNNVTTGRPPESSAMIDFDFHAPQSQPQQAFIQPPKPNIIQESTTAQNLPGLETQLPIQPPQNDQPVSMLRSASIIPPPPMFSNLSKLDNTSNIGQSTLPPSVARRLSANKPLIKAQMAQPIPTLGVDIFTPSASYPVVELNQSEIPVTSSESLNVSVSSLGINVLNPEIDLNSFNPVSNNLPKTFSNSQITSENIDVMNSIQSYGANTLTFPTDTVRNFTISQSTDTELLDTQNANKNTELSSIAPTIFTPQVVPGQDTFSSQSVPMIFVPPSNAAATNQQPCTEPKDIHASVNHSIFTPSLPDRQMPNLPLKNNASFSHQDILSPPIPSEPPKVVPEPPRLSSDNCNFRMTKKRPQYYSGPIEGVGSISNNIKPRIAPAHDTLFQGALFTPDLTQSVTEQALIAPETGNTKDPFDVAQPIQNIGLDPPITNYADMKQDEHIYTAFDLSRQTTEYYEPKSKESTGFGIIGSLKSKLSSIDINKIQNSVTNFFDPAYSDSKKVEDTNIPSVTYGQYPHGHNHPPERSPFSGNQHCEHPTTQAYSDSKKVEDSNISSVTYGQYPHGHNHQPKPHPILGNQHYDHPTTHYEMFIPDIGQPPTMQNYYQTQNQHQGFDNQHYSTVNDPSNFYDETKDLTFSYYQNVTTQSYSTHTVTPSLNTIYASVPSTINSVQPINPMPTDKNEVPISTIQIRDAKNFFDQENIEGNNSNLFDKVTTGSNLEENQGVNKNNETPIINIGNNETPNINISNESILQSINSNMDKLPPQHGTETNLASVSSTSLFNSPFFDNNIQNAEPLETVVKENVDEISFPTNTFYSAGGSTISHDNNAQMKRKISFSSDNAPMPDILNVPLYGFATTNIGQVPEILGLERQFNNIKLLETSSNLDLGEDIGEFTSTDDDTLLYNKDSEADNESNFNICETCREVHKVPEEKEVDDLTSQLIENITAPIQLSNPVEVPLTESTSISDDVTTFDSSQCAEISHITEETRDTIHVQSAPERLDDLEDFSATNYGWMTKEKVYPPTGVLMDHDYGFHPPDPKALGFFGGNSLFFDTMPTNASDEIKAEFQGSHEDSPILTTQMTIPCAPPIEDIQTEESDEAGVLDVNSIEQDAKKDFPVFEEYVIEPSETDDDKIELKELDKIENSNQLDSFTNRVEKFKQLEETGLELTEKVFDPHKVFGKLVTNNPAMTIASYFDTGNYAVETHYRNSLTSPSISSPSVPVRIPPGFENHFARNASIASLTEQFKCELGGDETPMITDTTTQTISIDTVSCSIESQRTEVKPIFNVDTHYCNSLTSPSINPPSIPVRVPPGFENHFAQNASIVSITEQFRCQPGNDETPMIPETTTQTKSIFTVTCSIESQYTEVKSTFTEACRPNATHLEDRKEEIDVLPPLASVFGNRFDTEIGTGTSAPTLAAVTDHYSKNQSPGGPKPDPILSDLSPLPDPINFFSLHSESTAEAPNEPDNSFNRLASYFSSPPKTDPAKSFFELSQSQNHYRHMSTLDSLQNMNTGQSSKNNLDSNLNLQSISPDRYLANLELIKELTSTKHIEVSSEDQVVRTVNYFNVEHDNTLLNHNLLNIPDKQKNIDEIDSAKDNDDENEQEEAIDNNDNQLMKIITSCESCSYHARLNKQNIDNETVSTPSDFNVKKIVDSEKTGPKSEPVMEGSKSGDNNGDNRTTVVNFDNINTGGEAAEHVDLVLEHRPSGDYVPVKHHWFYRVDCDGKSVWRGFSHADSKALEDAFNSPTLNENTLVPTDGGRFDVNIMGRLRFAVYWSEKPTNVWRCSWFYKGTTDARYVPYSEAVAEKLEEEYRHGIESGVWHRRLLLPNSELVVMHGPSVMVHFLQTSLTSDALSPHPQSTMRPRVVRRGHDELEIEDPEPSSIDHLLLLCHGVGSACDMRFRAVEEVVDDFRTTSLQLIQGHYKNSYDSGLIGRVEVLPISWHSSLHSGQTGVDRRLAQVTLDSIPRLRNFTNDTILDVLFYTSPVYCQLILDTVCNEMNRIFELFQRRNPGYTGGVSLGGHSLGSVILYDLLCHQMPAEKSQPSSPAVHKTVPGSAGTGQPCVNYPQLQFTPTALYALGSPIAIFECIRGVELLGEQFRLPTCEHFFNIFHPYDPIAYRIEPLLNPQLKDVKPYLIPHHKGRKRMHLELKDTMARVGADLKQKLVESIKSTWASMWKSTPPTHEQLEKVVEEEIEKGALVGEDTKEDDHSQEKSNAPVTAGSLNGGRRVDYVLQEAPFEMINEYLFAMSSHVGYWESEDTMLLMLREIYSGMGVSPDASVPQPNMTVERERSRETRNGAFVHPMDPSTSRGNL